MKEVFKNLLVFAGPIILGQLSQMLIGVGDVYVAGKHSTQAVAAIGVANGIISPVFLFGLGLMLAISPKLALKRGEGQDVTKYMPSLMIYVLFASVVSIAAMFIVLQAVPFMNIAPALIPVIKEYINIVAWSFFPAYFFIAFKEFLQSFEKVLLPNVISILAVFLNLLFNYLLVFGWEFIPAMGVSGLAWASLGVRVVQGLAIIPFVLPYLSGFNIVPGFNKEIMKFGFPIALSFFVEVLAFSTVNVLSGVLGVVEAASNNIVLNLAGTAFMVPLSIASAASVKVGAEFGAKNLHQVKVNIKASMLMTFGFMSCTGLLFWFAPSMALGAFTQDSEVMAVGITLLGIVALFQLFDGAQITLAGCLRGLQESRAPSAAIFIGYWLIGIPFGLLLTFKLGYGVLGLWIGLAVSLALVSIGLSIVLYRKIKVLNSSF